MAIHKITSTNEWGMFTKAGNISITNKFNVLIKKLNNDKINLSQTINAFSVLFKIYTRMSDTKNYGEAGDTDVRDQVWSCAASIARQCKHDIDESTLNLIWDHRYEK